MIDLHTFTPKYEPEICGRCGKPKSVLCGDDFVPTSFVQLPVCKILVDPSTRSTDIRTKPLRRQITIEDMTYEEQIENVEPGLRDQPLPSELQDD